MDGHPDVRRRRDPRLARLARLGRFGGVGRTRHRRPLRSGGEAAGRERRGQPPSVARRPRLLLLEPAGRSVWCGARGERADGTSAATGATRSRSDLPGREVGEPRSGGQTDRSVRSGRDRCSLGTRQRAYDVEVLLRGWCSRDQSRTPEPGCQSVLCPECGRTGAVGGPRDGAHLAATLSSPGGS